MCILGFKAYKPREKSFSLKREREKKERKRKEERRRERRRKRERKRISGHLRDLEVDSDSTNPRQVIKLAK